MSMPMFGHPYTSIFLFYIYPSKQPSLCKHLNTAISHHQKNLPEVVEGEQ